MKNALFTFNRLGQTRRKFFNLRGISIIIYKDDILILSKTFEKCIKDAQFVIDTLIRLGFHIKIEKCALQTSQHFFLFLGYLWDTNRMICELPQEKLQNSKFLCKVVLANTRVSARLMQRLRDCVTFTRAAVPRARAKSRGIQRMPLDNYKSSSANKLEMQITLHEQNTRIKLWTQSVPNLSLSTFGQSSSRQCSRNTCRTGRESRVSNRTLSLFKPFNGSEFLGITPHLSTVFPCRT